MTNFQVDPAALSRAATHLDNSAGYWETIHYQLADVEDGGTYYYFNDVNLILQTRPEYDATWSFHDGVSFGAHAAITDLAHNLRQAAANYKNADAQGAATIQNSYQSSH